MNKLAPKSCEGHIDLFSGIAGFSLAAQTNGLKTEVFCENDERCRQFLERTYPGIPIIPDVRQFNGTKWRGRFLLTGGVPCQPASRAGKQGGKKDDRWLWGEALRVIEESRPRWVLLENPPGIYDVGIDGILSHLEGIGYEVGVCEIPACAVNSPQIRQRVWIVAHSNQGRPENRQCLRPDVSECLGNGDTASNNQPTIEKRSQSNMADTAGVRWETGRTDKPTKSERRQSWDDIDELLPDWSKCIWVPCADGKLRRSPDDSFSVVDGLHRSALGALGNSICWPVAAEIIKAIILTDQARA